MKALIAAACVVALSNSAFAAEDHSVHQHHGLPPSASNDPSSSTQSETEHIAPAPPTVTMDGMSDAEMNRIMEMNDNPVIATLLIDRAEWTRSNDEDVFAWDTTVHYGNDFDKLVLSTEGERSHSTADSRNELLWDRIVSRWWSMEAGLRYDTHEGPSRTWAALGMRGLAAYWFDFGASIYVADQGRTALRIDSEYELLLTQRWMLQPRVELNAYGKQDETNGIGSGLADGAVGLRVRYEIRREFAPYVGISWTRRFGETANFATKAGLDRSETQWLAGVRVWF